MFESFLYAFIAIFPMVNPIAMSSMFFSLTEGATNQQRRKLALYVSFYGVLLLLGTLVLGPLVLEFFGLKTAHIHIAGGLVVFSIAWKMLLGESEVKTPTKEDLVPKDLMSLAFFPLTMPLSAGAGSIAIVVSLATNAREAHDGFFEHMAIGFAIIAIFVLVFICYSSSALIFNKLGKSGSKVVSSLSAFILLAIGVSVIWSGIQILLASVGHGQVFAAKRGVAPHF